MKKVLITGASGFLGSYTVRHFEARSWKVFALGRGGGRPLTDCSAISIFEGELTPFFLRSVIAEAQPDVVVHCAGCSSVPGSFRDPQTDFQAGPQLTKAVLEALRLEHPIARFVFLSSAAVYGNPRQHPVSENADLEPLSPYGVHKRQTEELCIEYTQKHQLETVVARVFSAYGLGLHRQVIWDLCRAVTLGQPLRFQGTGLESRDFIHGRDVAAAVELLSVTPGIAGEVFNVSTGRETTIRELSSLILSTCHSTRSVEFDGIVPPGTPLNWRADISRIASLGFSPEVKLEDGVAGICHHLMQSNTPST